LKNKFKNKDTLLCCKISEQKGALLTLQNLLKEKHIINNLIIKNESFK